MVQREETTTSSIAILRATTAFPQEAFINPSDVTAMPVVLVLTASVDSTSAVVLSGIVVVFAVAVAVFVVLGEEDVATSTNSSNNPSTSSVY